MIYRARAKFIPCLDNYQNMISCISKAKLRFPPIINNTQEDKRYYILGFASILILVVISRWIG